jgi:hypothetical protein
MGYPTKVQLIQRQASQQWYINFPAVLAQAMEFTRGETVEWIIEDRTQLLLRRLQPPPSSKKKRLDCSTTSASSGKTARRSAASGASSSARKPSP